MAGSPSGIHEGGPLLAWQGCWGKGKEEVGRRGVGGMVFGGALGWTGDGIGWKGIVIKSSVCPSYHARLWDRPD